MNAHVPADMISTTVSSTPLLPRTSRSSLRFKTAISPFHLLRPNRVLVDVPLGDMPADQPHGPVGDRRDSRVVRDDDHGKPPLAIEVLQDRQYHPSGRQ